MTNRVPHLTDEELEKIIAWQRESVDNVIAFSRGSVETKLMELSLLTALEELKDRRRKGRQ